MKKVLVGGVTAALLGLSPLAAFAASMNPDDYCSDFNATLTVSDSTTPVTSDGQTYSNSNSDGSGVYVSNGATATLTNAMISTSGASNTNTAFPSDESTQYGINSGVLVNGTGSTLTITGGSITTSGYIANAAFATEGGTINISGTADNPFTITATGYHSHGVDVTYGGTINLSYVTISTSQDISSGVATDFGGGTINADHITVTTNGGASAGIYVIGDGNGKITVTNSTITSEKSEGADVAGGGTLNLTDTNVTGVNALKLFTTGTTAEAGTATISGGSLTSTGGDAIVFSNDTGTVTVEDGCTITASNGILVDSTSCSAGSVIANGETLTGGIITDSTSTLAMSLANSSFTGYTSGSVALTMDSSSQWNLNTDSTLTAFNDNSGTVTFTSPSTGGAYYTLATTGDLSGSGTFNMNVDLSTAKANLITIGGTASGSYTLYFTGQNSSSTLSDDVKVVDLADSATNTATFTGGGDLGAYRYAVALGSNLSSGLDGSDYYLYNTYKPSTPAYAAIANTADTTVTWYGEMNEIKKRLGDLRTGSQSGDIWARTYTDRYKATPSGGQTFYQTMNGVEIGKDNATAFNGGKRYVGFVVGETTSENTFNSGGTGHTDSIYVGSYSSWIKDNGAYFDLIGKYSRFNQSFDTSLYGGGSSSAKYNNNGFGLSAEIGRHIERGNGVYVEPQAELAALWAGEADYTSSNGLAIKSLSSNSLQLRLGGVIGKKMTDSRGISRQVYGKLSWVHEFDGDSQTVVNEATFDSSLKGSQVVTGIGYIEDVVGHQIYLDIEKSWGSSASKLWGANLGYRWKV